MALPHFEVASGVIDGVNTIFTVALAYRTNTLAAFLNGELKRQDFDDGWVETSPSNRIFTMKQAPRLGDVVQAFYIDTLPAQAGEEISPIKGTIVATDAILGTLSMPETILGAVNVLVEVSGRTFETTLVVASLKETDVLIGRAEAC